MFIELVKDALGQKPGYRFDTDDALANSLIEKGVAKRCEADPLAPAIAKSLETLVDGMNRALDAKVDSFLKEFATTLTKSRKNAVPAIFGNGNGDPKKTFGRFLIAVRTGDAKTLEEMGSHRVEWSDGVKAAMNTNTGTQGGYAVPTEFYGRLMAIAAEKGIVRKRATIIPMKARTIEVPSLDHTTAPTAGDSAFLGGLVARWTEEGNSLNQTEPQLKQVPLTNHELSGYSKLSNSFMDDEAVGLEQFLYKLMGDAIAWHEDYAFLRGDGVGKPLGPVNWTGLISVTRSAASAFAVADAAGMLARFLPGWDRASTCWAVHPTVLAKLFQMSESGTGSDLMIVDRGSDAPTMSLLGIPVEVTEKLPGLNTAGDILLGNWSHYLLGDRGQVEIAYSEHAGFTTNQTFWRFVTRVGGQPWLRDKVTLADASNSLSSFVTLAAG